MPGPPPPPPGGPPPPPAFMPPPPKAGGSDDRSALLKSIQKGTKLKKTVTVDKSGPIIPGKVSNFSNTNNDSNSSGRGATSSGAPMTNGLGLGALFQGGVPKLRSTGKKLEGIADNSFSNNSSNPNINSQQHKSYNTQKEIKKQMANNDHRSRGPPPPAPVRYTSDEGSSPLRPSIAVNNGSLLNGMHCKSNLNISHLESNHSSLHRKASSNVNLPSLDTTDSQNSLHSKPAGFGKPNLAPKPPVNGKKPIVNGRTLNRAQSMKGGTSPSPQSPDKIPKFGTVRNAPPELAELFKPKSVPNERPKAPPPSIPAQYTAPPTVLPAPPSKLPSVKHPGHAPPPPPGTILQAPNKPPPLPPHRTAPQVPARVLTTIPGNTNGHTPPPPPPPRNSSIKDGAAGRRTSSPVDFDVKFATKFHGVNEFPSPLPFQNLKKDYRKRPGYALTVRTSLEQETTLD